MAVTDRRYNKQEDNMAEFEFTLKTDLAPIRDATVVANFDEALAAVRQIVATYQNLAVTPDTVREAAGDRARLRKLRDRIDDQRKAVKAAYMAPVDAYTAAAKPILDEIDAAINNIDGQVKAFEERERQEKLGRLREFFDEQNAKACGVVEWDKIAARHPEWKNKGCTEDKAKSDILTEFAGIERGIKALSGPGYEEKYRVPMIDKFLEKYDLYEATTLYTTLKQREAEEAARQQREAERARADAERKLREAEAERQRRQIAAETAQALNREFTRAETETSTAAEDGGDAPIQTAPAVKRVEFWVEVTSEQAKALGRFLRENGIRYGAIGREG